MCQVLVLEHGWLRLRALQGEINYKGGWPDHMKYEWKQLSHVVRCFCRERKTIQNCTINRKILGFAYIACFISNQFSMYAELFICCFIHYMQSEVWVDRTEYTYIYFLWMPSSRQKYQRPLCNICSEMLFTRNGIDDNARWQLLQSSGWRSQPAVLQSCWSRTFLRPSYGLHTHTLITYSDTLSTCE